MSCCRHASLAVAENTERVELAVLKPLWQLYTKMLKKYGKLVTYIYSVYHVSIT